jgi:signal transduction histidine kinase
MSAPSQHELLAEIPSPSKRLWLGLCVILSIFIVFAAYTTHEVRWLEDFQVNVVEKNHKASLQLLRLQQDAYLLAISLRDMTQASARYPIHDYRAEFTRLRHDMDDATRLESQFAVSTPASNDKRLQLHGALQDFWRSAEFVFTLAERGQEAEARTRAEGELESQRAVVSEIVARLLVLNDQAQADAAERISAVYGNVKRDILVVVGALFLLALATGLYTFEANRKTFERLHHLAEQLQSQSEQLRKLSWKLIDVQEETLRQVARDLHDEFGQILTAIGAMLSRAGRKAADAESGRNGPLLEDLQEVQKIVQDTLQSVRDRSQMFRPAILDDFGLEQTLEWFVRQFSRQAGVRVSFAARMADVLFPPEEAIHIYRIVQEALNNVARHARTGEAQVTLEERDGELRLEIQDHGAGFEVEPPGSRSAGDGLGLMGMRERAEHLGGSLLIQSAPGVGTTVSARIPLKKSAVPLPAEKAS